MRSLSILTFHRVLAEPDELRPDDYTAAEFERVIRTLKRWFNVLPLDEGVAALRSGRLCSRAVAITFDDGYADNVEVALPILARHSMPATFFIALDFLDGGLMWNDRVIEAIRLTSQTAAAFPAMPGATLQLEGAGQKLAATRQVLGAIKRLAPEVRADAVNSLCSALGVQHVAGQMMSRDQVLELRDAGMGFGAHTLSHPILSSLDEDAAESEIRESRSGLEKLVEHRVGLFAYPNGVPDSDYTRREVALVKQAGFDAAFTTAWGCASSADNPFELPRLGPWDRSPWKFSLRIAQARLRNAPAARAA